MENIFLNFKYPGWNVGKTLEHLLKNSKEKSVHKCAKYVREALNAGGINTNGNPIKAQEYHTKKFLTSKNFNLVNTLENDDINNFNALPGDIAVMYAPTGDTGHICMWTGNEWVSDFKQKSLYPYNSKGNNPKTVWIYRWNSDNFIDSKA